MKMKSKVKTSFLSHLRMIQRHLHLFGLQNMFTYAYENINIKAIFQSYFPTFNSHNTWVSYILFLLLKHIDGACVYACVCLFV